VTTAENRAVRKILFVVGAGASDEVGLPFGDDFKNSITRRLDFYFDSGQQVRGDEVIASALRIAASSENPSMRDIQLHLQASWRIRDALPQAISIDHLLDAHKENKRITLCGKLAIVHTVLEAERRSKLFVDRARGKSNLNHVDLNKAWHSSLLRLLTENCSATEFRKRVSTVAFVVFNYDRCVEQYLYYSLQNYYSISEADAASLVNELKIYHPYGSVGPLPWQERATGIEFGETPPASQLLKLSDQIRTFAEGIDASTSAVGEIWDNVRFCQRLVFLGFAFHQMNLKILLPPPSSPFENTGKLVFATAFGISDSNIEEIRNELVARGGMSSGNIRIRRELKCRNLIDEYWRSMSLI